MRFMQTESVLQTKNRSGPAKNRFSVALLWIIVDANNKNFVLSLENAFLCKRSSLLHKDIEFHVCILTVCETVTGFTECMGMH